MLYARRSISRPFSILLIFSVALQASGEIQAPEPDPLPAQDVGWPRQVSKDGNTLIYYQPQIDEWRKYKELYGNVAFRLTLLGSNPVMGVASVKASTDVNRDTRTVYIRDIDIPSVRFPSMDPQRAKPLEKAVKELLPHSGEPISIDRVIADLDQEQVQAEGIAVNNEPPPILFSNTPAVLLIVNGKPVLSAIEKSELQFVVNTNWDLFFDKKAKLYYLLVASGWLSSASLQGPWTTTGKLPADFSKLPAGQNFDAVKKFVPPSPSSGTAYSVIYSDKPAELILTKGSPVYVKVPSTHLLYVTNTENDLIVDSVARQFYVLLSGRWFRSNDLHGPWTFASDSLPPDFSKIPENSSKARVLASIPGTIQAKDAVLLAQIPTTAVVNKADAEAKVNAQGVHYDGQPKFVAIEKTDLTYASNTQDKVIKQGDLYYLCFQGVWFMSTKPIGPWKTADSVPSAIYTIPPHSPVYNVTYVTQTGSTTTTVESSTAAGYFGMFVIGMTAGMAIAYGTGYYWPPYIYYPPGMIYPVYRPWPYSYGAGYVYNPWHGGWSAGRVAYGPYGAAGSSAWFNPATGRYGRAASVQGVYGGRTVAAAYNPWTGGYGATSQGRNAYAQWGQSAAVRGNQWVQTSHVSTANGTLAGYRGSGGQGALYRGSNGTVARGGNYTYAGHDGNVYRRNNSGNWSQYNNGSWNNVDTSGARQQAQQKAQDARQQWQSQSRPAVSSETMQGLKNSAASRERGQLQTQRFQNLQRRGSGVSRR
jgi:hypothetical protein